MSVVIYNKNKVNSKAIYAFFEISSFFISIKFLNRNSSLLIQESC